MLSLILAITGGLAALIALGAALRYVTTVTLVNVLYRDLQFAEGDQVKPRAASYWSLERSRRRAAAVALIGYAVVIIGSLFLGDAKTAWHIAAMVGGSIAAAGIGLTASINNMKQDEIRIEAEVSRRYR
jgi:hypothetical protein